MESTVNWFQIFRIGVIILIRYIIEKFINNEHGYGHGYSVLMDGNRPRTFISNKAAFNWLIENNPELKPKHLNIYYNIKECII